MSLLIPNSSGVGRDSDGTPIWGWADQSAAISTFDQQWLVVDAGTPGEYILRNVRGGTYMDLDKGSNVDGTIVHGSRRAGISQQWIIEPSESDGYMR
jgi:Ricin-type beta-trefoil lectin domain-like